MTNRIRMLALLTVFAWGTDFPVRAETAVSCGDRVEGSIDVPGEIDSFHFEGVTGEAIQIAGESLDLTLQAQMKIISPSGAEIGDKSIARTRSESIRLPQTGLYRIEISDFNAQNTGRYAFSLQFTTGRCAEAISCGITRQGEVSQRAEMRAFRFDGTTGEAVRISSVRLRETLSSPAVEVFTPEGESLAGAVTTGFSESLQLPEDGVYTLIVSDFFTFFEQPSPDTYLVSLQFTTGRCAIEMTAKETSEIFLESSLQQDAFSVKTDPGEWLHVDTEALDYEEWRPLLSLYDPLGLKTAESNGPDADFRVSKGGEHTLLVTSRNGEDRSYRILVRTQSMLQFPLTAERYSREIPGMEIAVDSSNGEYFAAFPLDLAGTGEYEIYGQRIDSGTHEPLGIPKRLSDMGEDFDPAFAAFAPDVVFNPEKNEYLAVWVGDDSVDGRFSIYGQRIDAETSEETGENDFKISSTVADLSGGFEQFGLRIADNPAAEEYLAVWQSSSDQKTEIRARRVSHEGSVIGQEILLSRSDVSGARSLQPDLLYNPDREMYLAVWRAGEFGEKIYGRHLDAATGVPLKSAEFLIGADSPTEDIPAGVAVAYNVTDREYLVVWASGDGSIRARDLRGSDSVPESAAPFPITFSDSGKLPTVAYSPLANQYLVVWQRDYGNGEYEISGQRIDGSSGIRVGNPGFRISFMGAEDDHRFGGFRPSIAYVESSSSFLVGWDGNSFLPQGGNQIFAAELPGTLLSENGGTRWILSADDAQSLGYDLGFTGVPAVDFETHLYAGGGYGDLSKVESNGRLQWAVRDDDFVPSASAVPMVRDDGVILLKGGADAGLGNLLRAFDDSGQTLWTLDSRADQWFPGALGSENTVYAPIENGGLRAIDSSGLEIWSLDSSDMPKPSGAPVVNSDGQVLYASEGIQTELPSFMKLSASNGMVEWDLPFAWAHAEDFPIALAPNGIAYIGGERLAAVDAKGTLLWSVPLGSSERAASCSPILAPEGTVLCAADNTIQKFNSNGERVMVFFSDREEEVFSPFVAVDDDNTIYALSTRAEPDEDQAILYAVDFRGELRWQRKFDNENFFSSVPVLSDDGLLYFISASGRLFSVLTGSGDAARKAWNEVGGDSRHTNRQSQVERPGLYFAHFGRGGGILSSQILLLNPRKSEEARASINFRDGDGLPLPVEINGETIEGDLEISIAAGGLRALSTGSEGDVVAGSLRAESDFRLGGVVLFGGSSGLAGVGESSQLLDSFLAPIEMNASESVRSGIGVMNLRESSLELEFELLSSEGQVVSEARARLAPRGHWAKFVDELTWSPPVDLGRFQGSLLVHSPVAVSATVLQSRPGELATMPVISVSKRKWGKLPVQRTGSRIAQSVSRPYRLNFAQFAGGDPSLFSQILLVNPDDKKEANVEVFLRGDGGQHLSASLNGMLVSGSTSLVIPPLGLRVLKTDDGPELSVGSVIALSDQPVGGVIVFGGSVGLAGVGASRELSAFVAPVETSFSRRVNTGIALMNLESVDLDLDLELRNEGGVVVARSRLAADEAVRARGHLARFIDQFEWDRSVDFHEFRGILEVSTEGKLAATVLRTAPGQFATMPVVAVPAH